MREVYISNAKIIQENTFVNCKKLSNIYLPTSVTSIESNAFAGCLGLTEITIPYSVTSIGDSAFMDCRNLKNINMSKNIVTIEDQAFYDCQSLESITIPESVQYIGNIAFAMCYKLKEIEYNAKNCADFTAFSWVFDKAGRDTDGIHLYIGTKVESIPAYIFYKVTKLINIDFPKESKINSIGSNSFAECMGLTRLIIPTTMGSINTSTTMFSGCFNLTTIFSEDTYSYLWNKYSVYYGMKLYYYSYSEPVSTGNFWRYVNGEPVIWAKYNVTLNKQGGNGGSNSTEVYLGSTVPSGLAAPYATGNKVFGGYYSKPVGGIKYINADMTGARQYDIQEDTTLYARWISPQEIIEMTLKDIGRYDWMTKLTFQADINFPTSIYSINVIYPSSSVFSILYDFDFTQQPNEIILYVEHEPTGLSNYLNVHNAFKLEVFCIYDIDFNANGGEYVPSESYISGDTISKPINDPIRDGYTFVHWSLNGYENEEYDWNTPVFSDISLKAVWKINVYTITFDPDCVLLGFTIEANHGTKINKPLNDPKLDGETFMFWALISNIFQEYNWNQPITGDITLVAIWNGKIPSELIWDGKIAKRFAGGNGTQNDPYKISSGGQLALLADSINVGSGTSSYYVLTNDIFLNDITYWSEWSTLTSPKNWWTPIGTESYPFSGNFNGNGHVIRGMYFYSIDSNQGLFGVVNGGIIDNVGVEQSFGYGMNAVGGIVGLLDGNGLVINCHNFGIIKGRYEVGGIVGNIFISGKVINCYNTGSVQGLVDVGGIVGSVWAGGTVFNCYNIADISGTDLHYVGGIIGWNRSNSSSTNYYLKTSTINSQIYGVGTGSVGVNSYRFDENGVLKDEKNALAPKIYGIVRETLIEALNSFDSNYFRPVLSIQYLSWSGTPYPIHSSRSSVLNIRTQAEFNALISSPNWYGASEVYFIGNGGSYEFVLYDAGIKVPQTVKSIEGINNATIRIHNFLYSETNKGGLWYEFLLTDDEYSIKGITLYCEGPGTTIGFYNFINMTACYAEVNGRGDSTKIVAGFKNCTNLVACVSYCASPNISPVYGFSNCYELSGCLAYARSMNVAYGFYICKDVINCFGSGTATGSGYCVGAGFSACTYLTLCEGEGTSYGFSDSYYLNYCTGTKYMCWEVKN